MQQTVALLGRITSIEYGSIEREIHVDASPDVVFEVVSKPEHIKEWWSDDASFESKPGAVGELVWGDRVDVEGMIVVEVDPPCLFSFRWCYPDSTVADDAKSLLVTFELTPVGAGTRIRLTESGWRERGWEAAQLEEMYREHISGWDTFVPRLGEYIARLVSTR
ncbi:SRPBCC domain-containing protein [Nocardia crassostreae]|uniref:SRPBCC domain-containing protein n=1 Tax=Nocardia crassostreae TaxID=53428 RepID=UPI0024801A4C|nr:SRPBCC domain-containing protein [Nocardia crassostreae]